MMIAASVRQLPVRLLPAHPIRWRSRLRHSSASFWTSAKRSVWADLRSFLASKATARWNWWRLFTALAAKEGRSYAKRPLFSWTEPIAERRFLRTRTVIWAVDCFESERLALG